MKQPHLYLNLRGQLVPLDRPLVMGIVNVTDDSFYSGSRTLALSDIKTRVRRLVDEGADCLDVGGYSSRPGAPGVTPEEEYRRVAAGLEAIAAMAPDVPVSVDTFRASVARQCAENWNVDIINDISGGDLDPEMWNTVAQLGLAYVLMHMRGTPATMQTLTGYNDITADVLAEMARKIRALHLLGVKDVIADPGFGFAKTLEQNYRLMAEMKAFATLGVPVLAGISRKSMIYRLLDITPEDSLNGTTVLNTVALLNGAHIIRVHDVKPAVEAVKIVTALRQNSIELC